MEFALTEAQMMVQDMARNFAEKEIVPFVEEDEENHDYCREILTKIGELGLLGWSIPEEYGGNGMGWMEGIIALNEIVKVHISLRLSINGNCWDPAMTINEWGQKNRSKYIPDIVSGKAVGSFALTFMQ